MRLIIITIALFLNTAYAKTTLYYKVRGKNVTFEFATSRGTYEGIPVIVSEGHTYVKYGILYKGGFDFKGYNTLDGNMIINVKCNWKSRRSKSECTRVKFHGDDTFSIFQHKSSDLSLNDNFIDFPQTKRVKIFDLQPDFPPHTTIYDAGSLITLTPFLNFDGKKELTIYTNYKYKISKSLIKIVEENGDLQTLKVIPIYPDASHFKTLVIKIIYDKRKKYVTSFVEKIPVLGNLTVDLVKVEQN